MRTILLIVAVTVLAVMYSQPTIAQSASAQQERAPINILPPAPQRQGEVVKITGRNGSLSVPPLRLPPQAKIPTLILPGQSQKPAAISTPLKLQMVGVKGGIAPYAALSLKNQLVAGKAELSFLSPVQIYAENDGTPVTIFAADLGYAVIKVNAESANGLYLVDCAVNNSASAFSVIEGGDVKPQLVNSKNGHLMFLLEAPNAGWYMYLISNQHENWTFYSCNVSALK